MDDEELYRIAAEHRRDDMGKKAELAIARKARIAAEAGSALRHEEILDRLGSLDESVKAMHREEWKTWTFWIVLLALLVASAALLRDVVDWTVFGFDSPAPKHQSQGSPPLEPKEQQSPTAVLSPSPMPQPAAPPP